LYSDRYFISNIGKEANYYFPFYLLLYSPDIYTYNVKVKIDRLYEKIERGLLSWKFSDAEKGTYKTVG